MCFIINVISIAYKKMCFNINVMSNATKKIHHVFGLVVRVAISGEPRYTLVIYFVSLCRFCCRIPIEMGQPPGLAELYLFLFLFCFHSPEEDRPPHPTRKIAATWNMRTT